MGRRVGGERRRTDAQQRDFTRHSADARRLDGGGLEVQHKIAGFAIDGPVDARAACDDMP